MLLLAEGNVLSWALLTEDDVRRYLVHVGDVKRWARGSITIVLCGIKVLFEETCPAGVALFEHARVPHEYEPLVILSGEEVAVVLRAVLCEEPDPIRSAAAG